ncbi:MAG TPA: ISKra4 family transposase [Terriglobales bacterium]|nr:ISKra4 family transposase [Terriglobales bacterium]
MSALPCRPVADPFAAADQAYATITQFLRSQEARQVKHSDLERQLEGMGRELMRELLQAHLDLRQPGEAVEPVQDAAGTTLTPTSAHTRSLESIFGTVEVTRTGYGGEGTPSLHPLDGVLNLPAEKYSLEVRRRVAIEAAKSAFDEGVKTLEVFTGAHVPKRQFEELVIRAAQDFEAFYAERQTRARADPHFGPVLVLTVDGKGVVLRPEDLREATRRAAAQRVETFTARLGRGRRQHAKRMASVAAVYTIERFVRTPEEVLPVSGKPREEPTRPRPEHKRVWASLAHTSEEVVTAMFKEAAHRDAKRKKRWVALVDGNRTQIDHLFRLADERKLDMPIVVDFIHVAQYVWEAAKALIPEDQTEQDQWVRAHLLEILRGRASLVAAGIRRSATLRAMAAAERQAVDNCADYLINYAPYLQYDKVLAEGLPIATGVIEGTCRHLVEDRMNLTGARWSLTGAEAVLRLRALRSSDDFDAYWQFHEQQEYKRNHAAHYANYHVPKVVSAALLSQLSRRGTLKIVKKKGES